MEAISMPCRRAVLIILVGLLVVLSVPVAAQKSSTEPAQFSVLDYLDLALAHQPQRFDVPARTIAALPSAAASGFIAYIPQLSTTLSRAFRKPDVPVAVNGTKFLPAEIQGRLGLTDVEIKDGNYLRLLVGVLTLHADAGLASAAQNQYVGAARQFALGLQAAEMIASPPPPGSALAAAFERDRLLGRRELALLAEAVTPIARLAILAFGGRLTPSLLGDAQRLLEMGVTLFPGDAELKLALGAVHESLARPESQRDIESRKALARLQSDLEKQPGSFSRRMNEGERQLASMNRRAELATAARLFGQALEGASSHEEASLRLGHVLMEQGKAKDAVQHLNVAAASRDAFVRYNGLLLLARVNADAGRPGEAERCYRRAAAVFPDAQAPIIGLSLLDDDAGQPVAALDGLRSTRSNVAIPPPERDPWWVYYQGADRFAAAHLDQLYAAARAAAASRH
jgi:tetratricopeptide (TPR) repeat protein